MKNYLQTWLDYILSKFGYYRDLLNENVVIQEQALLLKEQDNQIGGLIAGYGSLEHRHQTHVLLLVSLLTAMGQEEYTFKWDFLKAIFGQNSDIETIHNEDNSITIKIVTKPMASGE